ncbi:MAG TPA: serine/threonine-protein kinase [Myxococcales bacterium]|nr:serine/threonine-protein kinase [Myxococcales bacterium]
MSYSVAPSPSCPDAAVLARYHEQKLGGEAARALQEHVKGCAHCQRRLARLDLLARSSGESNDTDDEATIAGEPNTSARTMVEDPRARPTDHEMPAVPSVPIPPMNKASREVQLRPRDRGTEREKDRDKEKEKDKAGAPSGTQYLEKGSRVGRYVIRDVIGVGGMGAVYSAYDPELNRRVALKVLRTRKRSGTPHLSEGRSRLMREAQAMARLSHPNIVTVFDVGSFEGEIYLAMELVDGTTLTDWLKEKKRTWKDVAKVFLFAGRGLAAAHAGGLVHRDFKPDNVLVGKDGRVRVMDFGLARPAGGIDDEEGAEDDELSDPGAKERSLLNSPLTRKGILVGTPVYMAPEQFLNEPIDARADQFAFCVALYEALYGTLPFQGDTVEDLAHAIVAARLPAVPPRRAIPLVVHRVLRRGMRSEPRDRYASMDRLLRSLEWGIHFRPRAAGAVAAAALAAFIVVAKPFQNAAKICPDPIGELAGVWDAPRQKAVDAAFAATRLPFARDTFHSVQLALDDYARDWAAARREACLATRVRREQSEDALDLKYGCLDRRRHELDELVGLFLNTDTDLLQRSVSAASALSPVRGCADLAALAVPASGPEQAELRAKVSEQRAKLASASARRHAGKYKEALAIAREVSQAATQLKFRALEAEALALRGRLEEDLRDYNASEQTLLDASTAAAAARLSSLAAELLIDVTRVMGNRQGRTAEAKHMGQLATGAIEGLGNPDELTANLFENLGLVAWTAGDYEAAVTYARRSLEIHEKLSGKDAFEVARVLKELGAASHSLGKDYDALAAYQRSLVIFEHVLGKDHPEVAKTLNNLGIALTAVGRTAEADAVLFRALGIFETSMGKESGNVAPVLNSLGVALVAERKYDQALVHLQRALELTRKTLGPEHPQLPPILNNIGDALLRQGRTEEALRTYQQALAIREKVLGSNHVNLANDLTGLGQTYLSMGKPELALAPLERALRLRESTAGAYPDKLAETRFALARALWATDGDRRRSVQLATSARDIYSDPALNNPGGRDEVVAWMVKHPLP